MIGKERILRQTPQQIETMKSGDVAEFIQNFIKLGANLPAEVNTASIKVRGPYRNDFDDDVIFMMTWEETKS